MLDLDDALGIVDGDDFEQLAVAAIPVAHDGLDELRVGSMQILHVRCRALVSLLSCARAGDYDKRSILRKAP